MSKPTSHSLELLPVNRHAEAVVLERLLTTVRRGRGGALVVSGEMGIGKTALLEHLVGQAAGFRVVRSAGAQSEMELSFAGLHQLCAPLLGGLDAIPAPRRDALRIAFGLTRGPSPDRFLVGLAVLSLLSQTAERGPLLCVVDDHQWLDHESAQALSFIARRLPREPIGLVFATRDAGGELAGLPALALAGLDGPESRTLLAAVLTGPLDARVRDQIVAEAQGNPLALVELPRGLTTAGLAGGFGLPGTTPLAGRIEESLRLQLDALAPDDRRLLRLAAADPGGDPELVRRAAAELGIPADSAIAAVHEAGLAEFGERVRFRHPLLRAAVYRAVPADERRRLHRALASATDPAADPDRRAWHRAEAAPGPDEEVAAELERSAARARARGGSAAAAAFLKRAVYLSVDPARRVERTLSAAEAGLQSGAFATVSELLASAQAGPLDALQSARADLLRGQVSFGQGAGRQAPRLLLRAARRLEPLSRDLARDTYLSAWMAGLFAGRHAQDGDWREISRAAQDLEPPRGAPDVADLVLEALAQVVVSGLEVAAPVLRVALEAYRGVDAEVGSRLGFFGQAMASATWDFRAWQDLLDAQIRAGRQVGALDRLPVMLSARGTLAAWSGDLELAAELRAEYDEISAVTGTAMAPFVAMLRAGIAGDPETALPLIQTVVAEAAAQGQGVAESFARWAAAILHNGLGRYDDAYEAATDAVADPVDMYATLWALPELVEAAVRTGRTGPARAALDRFARSAEAGGTDEALGLLARCRAMLAEGEHADRLYREAIERLDRTVLRTEVGRAHLVHGEWLRRVNRRAEARTALHAAHEVFAALGVAAFADRARRELLASGERTRGRAHYADDTLTAQETIIAGMVRDGSSNPEIAAHLFISIRTVEWHMRKVFAKLGISSRREVAEALARYEGAPR